MKRLVLKLFIGGLFLIMFSISGCGGGSGSRDNTNDSDNGDVTTDGWTIAIIDSNCNAADSSINAVLDKQGKLHVSYFDSRINALKYATNKSGTWSAVSVDAGNVGVNTPGARNDIAVDNDGNAYISYSNADNNSGDANVEALCYATNISGSWIKQNVVSPATGINFAGSSIAVDNTGKAHIAFYKSGDSEGDGHPYKAKYTNNVSGSWLAPETVGAMAFDGLGISMALDSSSKPYVAYTYGYGSLYSAVRQSPGTWSTQLIAGDPSTNTDEDVNFPALAIDPATNHPYIVFQNVDLDTLELSINSTAPSVLATTIGNGYFTAPSLIFTSGNTAHISYCNRKSNLLHYVTNKSGSWVDTPLTIKSDSGNSAIAVSSTGVVYIVYSPSLTTKLCVAMKQFN